MEKLPFPLCDKYLVYEDGRIFSLHRNKFLKPELVKGYHRVRIDGIRYMWHRVVAMTYHKNPKNKKCINHKDRNKLNNHKNNVEWCTQEENMQHLYSNGEGNFKNKGELNKGGGKLTTKNVIKIKTLLKAKKTTQTALAKKYNVSIATICEINAGKKWKHIII